MEKLKLSRHTGDSIQKLAEHIVCRTERKAHASTTVFLAQALDSRAQRASRPQSSGQKFD